MEEGTSERKIEGVAERLTATFMDTVEGLAAEHGLTTAEYLRAKAYHAHLEEYPFGLVVEAMRKNGIFRTADKGRGNK